MKLEGANTGPIESAPLPLPRLSAKYEARLRQDFGFNIAYAVTYDWKQAPHHSSEGEHVPYVRLNANNGTRPVLYVPGFTEGIEAKAAFAAELASQGYDVILPGQNRRKLIEDAATSKKSATYSQARNTLSILEAEGVEECDVITHSYGSLVFDAMARIAASEGSEMFADSRAVMLTPAGLSRERFFGLLGRLGASMLSEVNSPKVYNFPDMMKAGIKNVLANIPWTLRESVELSRLQVDYRRLLAGRVASLTVVTYAADRLYPDKALTDTVTSAVEFGATWLTPVGPAKPAPPEEMTYGKPNATHNDEQFNPHRIGLTLKQLLPPRAA